MILTELPSRIPAIVESVEEHGPQDAIARRLREAEAMRVVDDAGGVADALQALFADEPARLRLAANASRLLEDGRGALARTVTLIEPALPG